MKFFLHLHNFFEFSNLFFQVPVGNCFWCYFGQQFIHVTEAFSKCEKDY